MNFATFVDFDKHHEVTFSDVEYFIHRLSHLKHLWESMEVQALQEQFILYQLLQDTDILATARQEAIVKDKEVSHT